jgi:hypothetical protein
MCKYRLWLGLLNFFIGCWNCSDSVVSLLLFLIYIACSLCSPIIKQNWRKNYIHDWNTENNILRKLYTCMKLIIILWNIINKIILKDLMTLTLFFLDKIHNWVWSYNNVNGHCKWLPLKGVVTNMLLVHRESSVRSA